jgi:hypothetical protein
MSGGSSNRAQQEAQRAEEQRMTAIRGTQDAVNRVYDGPQRQADIADYVNATRTSLTGDLARQKADTDRQLKFAVARSGVAGGSTQVDQQANVAQDFSRGLLDVERRAKGAGADLEAQDQENRARLIALATSGLDATTAAQQAAAGMRSSLEAGKSTALAGGLGDAFADFRKNFIDPSRDAAARRKANFDTGFSLYPTQYGGGR